MAERRSQLRHLESTTDRLRHVAEELTALEEELYWTAMTDDPLVEQPERRLEQILVLELMVDVKASIDHTRQLMRAYIESLAATVGNAGDGATQRYRMQRVTELLRILRERVGRSPAASPGTSTFFESMEALIEEALRKHGPRAA